jgi:MFS family permease
LVFGRIGDLVGRKNTFLVTMTIMGLSTFCVGLLPNYATIGVAAPLLLVAAAAACRASRWAGNMAGRRPIVAEHAPNNKRGLYTSWIQTTATLGLFAALLVVISVQHVLGSEAFASWGWRVPFFLPRSLLLVRVGVDPAAAEREPGLSGKMKAEGARPRRR